MPRLLRFPAVFAAVALLGACAPGGGTAGSTAPSSPNTLGEAYRDAELVARSGPGRQTALGRGDSMAPVFGDNTLLVINPVRYEELAAGMTVAYRNSQGLRVVHRLVGRTRDGWMVAGFNNDRIDNELVTPQNLLGVVYATFYPTGEEAAAGGPGKK